MREYIDPGHGDVLIAAEWTARGAGSGAAVAADFFLVIRVEDGMAVSGRAYSDRGEALEAIGLRE